MFVSLLFQIYDTTRLINLCLFLHRLSPRVVFVQSCPAVQAASSRSARCLRLLPRLTPARVPVPRPTLKSACRGRPCRPGVRPARAARGETRAQAQTRHSSTTAGCSTATSPWRPGECKWFQLVTAPAKSFKQQWIFLYRQNGFEVAFKLKRENLAVVSCHGKPSNGNFFKKNHLHRM